MPSNILGIDIGGTKIFAGRYDKNLNLEDFIKIPTEPDSGKTDLLSRLLKTIEKLKDQKTESIGISFAGFLDSSIGKIIKSPNIPALNNFEITKFIQEKTGFKTVLENDARLFTLSEYFWQTPKPKNLWGITIGTGVGSGLLVDGKIFTGEHRFAVEIGHTTINGIEIEKIISGPALKKFLGVLDIRELDNTLEQTPRLLLPKILSILEIFSEWIANFVLAFDPGKVIIGGGTGKFFWKFYQTELLMLTQEKLKKYPVELNLEFSSRQNSGAEGAAILAQRGGFFNN